MTETEIDSAPEAKGVQGRPKIEFTEEQQELIKRLSELFCSQEEIAYALGVSRDTIQKHADLLDEGKARGRVKLRRAQMNKALEGNPTMLIWLGKQMLGQTDQPVDSNSTVVLPWESE